MTIYKGTHSPVRLSYVHMTYTKGHLALGDYETYDRTTGHIALEIIVLTFDNTNVADCPAVSFRFVYLQKYLNI